MEINILNDSLKSYAWSSKFGRLSDNGQFETTFLIGSITVCLTTWLAVLRISKSTYYTLRKKFQSKISKWNVVLLEFYAYIWHFYLGAHALKRIKRYITFSRLTKAHKAHSKFVKQDWKNYIHYLHQPIKTWVWIYILAISNCNWMSGGYSKHQQNILNKTKLINNNKIRDR